MTDKITIPPEVVRMAARRLSAGQTTVADVLGRVIEELTTLGWLVEAGMAKAEPPGTTHDTAGLFRLMLWPRELNPPFFDGEPGHLTIAPWSVKLTPEAMGRTERGGAGAPVEPKLPAPAARVPKLGDIVVTRYGGEDCAAIVTGLTHRDTIVHLTRFSAHTDHIGRVWNATPDIWRWPDEPWPT